MSSAKEALACGVCGEMCKRGVSLPCCGAQACRACATKQVNMKISSSANVCGEMCKRGVSLPCCGAQACRACATKQVIVKITNFPSGVGILIDLARSWIQKYAIKCKFGSISNKLLSR
jgi:hypothetical protein